MQCDNECMVLPQYENIWILRQRFPPLPIHSWGEGHWGAIVWTPLVRAPGAGASGQGRPIDGAAHAMLAVTPLPAFLFIYQQSVNYVTI